MRKRFAAVVDPPLADGDIQQVGPGLYSTEDQSFEIYETDVAGGVAKPESAPASRPDMGVFGPGWEAEFVGASSTASWSRRATPSSSPTSTRTSRSPTP